MINKYWFFSLLLCLCNASYGMPEQLEKQQELNRELGIAAKTGTLEEVIKKVREGGDPVGPSSIRPGSSTPLLSAAYFGHLPVVKYLVNLGADINEINQLLGFSPFQVAVMQGHLDIVKFLAVNGADLHALSKQGRSPYHIAQCRAENHIAQFIYDLDDNQHHARNNFIDTVKVGNYKRMLELLNQNQADINTQDQDGLTALMWAVIHNNYKTVSTLRKRGANREIANHIGNTALAIALNNQVDSEIIELLLS